MDDLLRLLVTSVIGLGLSAVAWYLARDEASLADQVKWANLSVAGFVVASWPMVVWLLRGRRAVGDRRRELLGEPMLSPRAGAAPVDSPSTALIAMAGRLYFHRAGCALTRGRPATASSLDQHVAAGRLPCGVCRP